MIPLISVIIPVYNQEKFINRCIRSILNQTIDKSSYEVIVIDDLRTIKTFEDKKKFLEGVVSKVIVKRS